MRLIIYYISIFWLLVSQISCSSNEPKEIPLDELKNMLLELSFMDTYAKMELSKMNNDDSITVYEPILRKYGYRHEDIAYTFERMASRKSNVAELLIEEVSKELESTKNELQKMSDLNKGWIEKGREEFKEVIYERNDVQTFDFYQDNDSLFLRFPLDRLGEYKFSYRYRIDSLDSHTSHYFRFVQRDSVKDVDGIARTIWMSESKHEFNRIKHDIEVKRFENKFNQLSYQLLYLTKYLKSKKTLIYVDSIRLEYVPLPTEAGRLYMEKKLGLDSVKIKIEQIKKEIDEKDISTFYDKWRGSDSLSVGNIR